MGEMGADSLWNCNEKRPHEALAGLLPARTEDNSNPLSGFHPEIGGPISVNTVSVPQQTIP